jgi:nicotinate-nucleotide pyrophosphorylase (carboxylating)
MPTGIAAAAAAALAEDVGSGDLTADLVDANATARASVVVRERAVLCGTAWFDEVYRQLDARVAVTWRHRDGDDVASDTVVCELAGPARALLPGERTALNFLQMLSGTATAARAAAALVADTPATILDTRKTLPGLRLAQKYAVRCGGASNHRIGLFDAVLIKENHVAAAGGVRAAVAAARRAYPKTLIEVEVETLAELDEALASEADRIMLDDFSLADVREAVRRRDAHGAAPRKALEVSGGVGADDLKALAATGVDFISMGALTKHVRAVDFSMRFA